MDPVRSRDAYPDSHGLGELRERLIVIETKLDHYNEIRTTAFNAQAIATRNTEDIRDLKLRATENRECSLSAKNTAETGRDDIAEMKENHKYLTRATVTLVLGVIGNLIFNLAQH